MKTIFIIDDNETNLAVARQAVENTYRVLPAISAERMFKLLQKITPDLILLDVEMPETNGFEAMAALRSDERFRGIPVIFLTAMYDEETIARAREVGALDIITKPFEPVALCRCIESHIGT